MMKKFKSYISLMLVLLVFATTMDVSVVSALASSFGYDGQFNTPIGDGFPLGDGFSTPSPAALRMATPAFAAGLPPEAVVYVTSGADFALAILNDGTLWAWGSNLHGQLGIGGAYTHRSFPEQVSMPAEVPSGVTWSSVAAADNHVIAILTDGSLWAWGSNQMGQLGVGDNADRNVPTPVPQPAGVSAGSVWESVSAGWLSSFAIRCDGSLWAWGFNSVGQLGVGDVQARNTPTLVQHLPPDAWSSVSSTGSSAGVDTDGHLWVWGRIMPDLSGQVATVPSPMIMWTGMDINSAVSGLDSLFLICNNNALWALGDNFHGQLGTGSVGETITSLQQIQPGTSWESVSSPNRHSVAISTNGTLWAWGQNANGELGVGDRSRRLSPVQVSTPTGADPAHTWQSVATGSSTTYALRTDGSLWAWGLNGVGQLGNKTVMSSDTPMQVIFNRVNPVTGITIVGFNERSLYEGTALTLEATVLPVDADNRGINWSSSNAYVASVNEGVVTAHSPGTARIEARTVEGDFTAYVDIAVFPAAPSIITSHTLPDGTIGRVYDQWLTVSGLRPIALSLAGGTLPMGLSFLNGTIYGIPTELGTFTFAVRATNTAGEYTRQFSLTIRNDEEVPPYLTSAQPELGTVGTPFSHTVTAESFTPVTWELADDSIPLPDGLTLDNGIISGTPTESGRFDITIRATNDFGSTTMPLTIIIRRVIAPPVINTTELPIAIIGRQYDEIIDATFDGFSILAEIESGELPPGLLLDSRGFGSGTRIAISGTPTRSGTFTFSIRVWTNEYGVELSDTREFTIIADTANVVRVSTRAELVAALYGGSDTRGRHVILENNISLGNWTPANNFQGILDGNGNTISLYVDRRHTSSLMIGGLFGVHSEGHLEIRNLSVRGNIIMESRICRYARAMAGGLIGVVAGGTVTIENVHYSGTVSARSSFGSVPSLEKMLQGYIVDELLKLIPKVGDYIAIAYKVASSIIESQQSNRGSFAHAGGFIGLVCGHAIVTITNSHAHGSVVAKTGFGMSDFFPGIVGAIPENANAGGLVGFHSVVTAYLTVDNVYTANNLRAETVSRSAVFLGRNRDGYAGGVVGRINQTFLLRANSNYRLASANVNAHNTNTLGISSTFTQANIANNINSGQIFSGWDFDNTWTHSTRISGMPYLQVHDLSPVVRAAASSIVGSDVIIQGETSDLTHNIERDADLLSAVYVNDIRLIPGVHFSVTSASTVITVFASFLDTLDVGTHTITVEFDDGEIANDPFFVEQPSIDYTQIEAIYINDVAIPFTIESGTFIIDDSLVELLSQGANSGTVVMRDGTRIEEQFTIDDISATITPPSKAFPVSQVGYINTGMEQVFTITNTGDDNIFGLTGGLLRDRLEGSDFEIIADIYPTALAPGETATIAVRPRNSLPEGSYTDTLIVMASNLAMGLTVDLLFTVVDEGVQTYTLTILAGQGGNIIIGTSGQYAPGTVIPITAVANSGYAFYGWTTTDGGVFEDASNTSTTFIMPDNDTTVTANFIYTSVVELLYGDLNGDGVVDSADLILMLRFFAQPGVAINKAAADFYGDGVMDNRSLIRFLRFFAQPGITLTPREDD